MSAAVRCPMRQSNVVATITLCLCGPGAWALDDLVPDVSATLLPRFEPDGATRTSRIDMTWLPPRRSALGLSVGNTGQSMDVGLHWRYTRDAHYRIDVTAWRRVTPPDAVSLVHLREPSYGARLEMRIGRAPTEPGFVAERGFVGFQLDSGARITVRRSGGRPMLYYRTRF